MSDPAPKVKKRRATQACDFCHRRAIKCQHPPVHKSCENCKRFGQRCTYNRRPKKRGVRALVTDGGQSGPNSTLSLTRALEQPWTCPPVASQATIVDLVELFFEVVYPIFPVFNRPLLQKRVSRGEHTSDRMLFMSIMAISASVAGRVRDGSATNRRLNLLNHYPSPDVFFEEAQRQLDLVGEQSNLHVIRSHALLCIAAIQNGRTMDLHKHLNKYHTIIDMYGLHDDSKWPAGMNVFEREERRRLFWAMYKLDVFRGMVWGSTIRSREQQANVAYPLEVDDELLPENGIVSQYGPDGIPTIQQDCCWLVGWNFVTDLYRVLEHVEARAKGLGMRYDRSGYGVDICHNGVSVTGGFILHYGALEKYRNLPNIFRHATEMTHNLSKDLFGFQAANITATLQLLRLAVFEVGNASIYDRCRVAKEVINEFHAIPVGYLVAIGTPLLHHLKGMGTILNYVLMEPMMEDEYGELRTVMLSMALLLDKLEPPHRGASVSEKLRGQVSRIDDYMNTQKQIESIQQGMLSGPELHVDLGATWSFLVPEALLSDLSWNLIWD
ncbi:hypothetical protein F4808DRAFT_474576 [Astrocystis sublimbata]|nr:hypothetical protein F4808DRAFT_474576 [Astrocystis sublimbata]